MDVQDLPNREGQGAVNPLLPGRLIGLQGRLARPFWGVMGLWACLGGALASNQLRWDGESLLLLALALLLADLAWGSLWDLAVGTDWFRPMIEGWPPARLASLPALPYTQPESPGGRVFRGLNRLAGWWHEAFWPAAGPALLGVLAAAGVTVILALILPGRLRPLYAALVALIGLGVIWQRRGRVFLAGGALAQVGLCWLAGHMVFAEVSGPSLMLAIAFSVAVWGGMRVDQRQSGGLWLLNGGQVAGVALLAALKQPLAAGAVGLLLAGQVVFQPLLRLGADPARIFRRTWPWLMVAMLVAALSLP